MARTRSSGTGNPRTGETQSANLSGATPSPPSLETVECGISNITRSNLLLDKRTAPFVHFMKRNPFDAFIRGWNGVESTTDIETVSDGYDNYPEYDVDYATSPYRLAHSKDTPQGFPGDGIRRSLYAKTQYAKEFELQWIPRFQDLVGAGLGSRFAIDNQVVVAYFSCLTYIHQLLIGPIVMNSLIYHTDWSKFYPYTPDTPVFLYSLADNWLCKDTDLREVWLELWQRFETNILPWPIISENKRLLAPMIYGKPVDRLIVPLAYGNPALDREYIGPSTDNNSTLLTPGEWTRARVTDMLDMIDKELYEQIATLRTFLPFPINEAAPFDVGIRGSDPLDLVAYDNSPWRRLPVTWDNGRGVFNLQDTVDSPDVAWCMVSDATHDVEEGALIPGEKVRIPGYKYNSMMPRPLWGAVRLTPLWVRDFNGSGGDIGYSLLTPHNQGGPVIIGDRLLVRDFTQVGLEQVDSGSEEAAVDWLAYEKFLPGRYSINRKSTTSVFREYLSLQQGRLEPGFFNAVMPTDTIEQLVRTQCKYDWGFYILESLTQMQIGRSLREIRATALQARNQMMISG